MNKYSASSFIITLLLSSLALQSLGQKEWYVGFDMGPKYDHFSKVKSKSSSSGAQVDIVKDIGATAGLKLGLNVDQRYSFEIGLYRNNYKVGMDLTSSQKNLLFSNEVVNTLNTYMVPLSMNMHFPLANNRQVFWFGGGISLLMNPTTDFNGSYSSPTNKIETNGTVTDQLQYNRYQHQYEGSIYTFNLNTGLDVALYENFFISLSFTGRIGIAGNDSYLVELNDDRGKALYKISNNGTALQSCVGFKYFFKTLAEQ